MLGASEIEALYPRAGQDHLQAFIARSDELFDRYGLTDNPIRLQFFLAQIGHESGGLTVVEENLHYSAERLCAVWPNRFADLGAAQACAGNPERLANTVYCDRMGNGSMESGDGWRYRGRGYIQLTGCSAYREVGRIAGLDLVDQPDLTGMPAHALTVACAFWAWKGLNEFADTGDFVKVTRRINGGTNGMADRNAWLDKVRRVLAPPMDAALQPLAEDVIRVQRALQSRGYREVGAADGLIGPRTISAIARFRQANDMPPGIIDDDLLRALGVERL